MRWRRSGSRRRGARTCSAPTLTPFELTAGRDVATPLLGAPAGTPSPTRASAAAAEAGAAAASAPRPPRACFGVVDDGAFGALSPVARLYWP